MKQYIAYALCIFVCVSVDARSIQVRQADVSQEALPIYVGWYGQQTDSDARMYNRFMSCLSYSRQFAPYGERLGKTPHIKDALDTRFREGYMLAIYVARDTSRLKWRVYDVPEKRMLAGRSFSAHADERVWAYSAARELWEYLTGQDAPFLSHITYVKHIKQNNVPVYQLCIADFDGTHERVLYTTSHYLMSPQWGWIEKQPVLCVSEFTPWNVRIVLVDTAGNARPLLDLSGTCVGFVQRAREIIYCRSGVIYSCYLDAKRNKRVHTPIVYEYGPCASPTVDESGNIYYCYNGMIKYYDRKQHQAKALLYRGYYVAPAYHISSRTLAYAQRIDGVMQLCTYMCNTKHVQQLTYDAQDKYDPRWSPCGQYLIYTKSGDTCVYTYNIYTHTEHRVTAAKACCMYPTWSPAKVYIA